MKRYLMLIGLGVILICFLTPLKAQFKVQAELRPRFEIRDGIKAPLDSDDKAAIITTQRSRLNLSYNNENVELYMSFQDVRTWGDEKYKTDIPVLNVYEAYAGYTFNNNLGFRLGRQNLSYDNKRLFGDRNWNNVGASHDVALVKYSKNDFTGHLVMAYNNDKEKLSESNYPISYYKYLTFLWLNNKFSDNFSASLINVADGNQLKNSNDTILTRFTSGVYTKGKAGDFGFDAAFYYQFGTSPGNQDLGAHYFSISPSYKVTDDLKLLLGLEYFSGDDAMNDNNKSNSFSKLYGNGHGPYGYMDYFTELPNHTKNGGLMDAYLKVDYVLGEKTTTELTFHNFQLTNNILDTISNPGVTAAADKQLGLEIDFMLKHKLNKAAEMRVGYSTMFASKSMEIIKGGDSDKYQQWFWLMFIFKPTLFEHKF